MLYLLVLLGFILGIFFEKNKLVYFLQLLILWIMLGWSYGNADYQNYLTRYELYDSQALADQSEWLFVQLFKLGNKLGLTYQEYLPILALIYIIALVVVIKKISPNPSFVLSMYMIFPACMEATQIRFAFGGIFVLIGFTILFNDKIKFGELKFALCVIVGALLHIGVIVFLAMIPIRWLTRKKALFYTLFLAAVVTTLGLGGMRIIISLFPGMLSKFTGAIGKYSLDTVVYWIGVQIFLWIFFIIMVKVAENFYKHNKMAYQNQYFEYIVRAGIISAVAIPVTYFFQDVYRIQQCLCILYFCALSWAFPEGIMVNQGQLKFSFTKNKIIFLIGCIVFTFSYLFIIVLSSSNINTVFVPYFEENIFVDFIKWKLAGGL